MALFLKVYSWIQRTFSQRIFLRNEFHRSNKKPSNQKDSDIFLASYKASQESAWEQPNLLGEGVFRKRLGLSTNDRIVFYACQVEDDANMLLYSPIFPTNEDFLRYVSKALQGISNTVLIVKPHPKEPKSIPNLSNEYGIRMIVEKKYKYQRYYSYSLECSCDD